MKRSVKTPADSQCFLAEIVGEESLIGQRMSAGKLLHMMDVAAACAGNLHCEGLLVTLAFDRIELLEMICHRDYVRYDAYVMEVGRSTMVVKVDGARRAPGGLEMLPGPSGIVTMVAIDNDRKPNKNIPVLTYKTPEELEMKKLVEARRRLLRNRGKMNDAAEAVDHIPGQWLKDYYPRTGHVASSATELVIRKRFLPRNSNILGNVFGGDTVELMEELALATARQFTGNPRMVTLAMEDVLFLKPLHLDDTVEMTARVVYVANTTLVVQITVKAISSPGSNDVYAHITNHGLFTVLNYDRTNRKKSIINGLDITDADLEMRKQYLKEQFKYEKRTGRDLTWNP